VDYKLLSTVATTIIAVLLVWGLVGASQADDVGISCNTGLGDSLCWTWEQNTVGDIQEFIGDVQQQADNT
jgi:hypothetical protein